VFGAGFTSSQECLTSSQECLTSSQESLTSSEERLASLIVSQSVTAILLLGLFAYIVWFSSMIGFKAKQLQTGTVLKLFH